MVPHDLVADRQTQAGALSDGLRGEEGVEDPLTVVRLRCRSRRPRSGPMTWPSSWYVVTRIIIPLSAIAWFAFTTRLRKSCLSSCGTPRISAFSPRRSSTATRSRSCGRAMRSTSRSSSFRSTTSRTPAPRWAKPFTSRTMAAVRSTPSSDSSISSSPSESSASSSGSSPRGGKPLRDLRPRRRAAGRGWRARTPWGC